MPYLFDIVRTPRGKRSLYEVRPVDLLGTCLRALQKRNQLDKTQVGDLIAGCVTPVDDQGYNIAKASLLYAGWDHLVSGMQINRYCASGLEAVNLAALKIMAGWEDLVLAGGVESMSRVPMGSDGGPLWFDPDVIHVTGHVPQGVAADLIATLDGYTRDELDQIALQSHQKAALAWENGYFNRSVIPICDRNGLTILDTDEHIRRDASPEKLHSLPPAFLNVGKAGFDKMAIRKYPQVEKIDHLHTAGNSSGIVDGAALALLGSLEKGKSMGLSPRGRILSVGNVSVDPTIMLTGPAPAARKALEKAGMTASDIDLWEVNEAFASVVLRFMREMNLEDSRVNVNGGAIAMGHPLGATGTMLLGILLDELERRDLSTGMVTLCAGGGMGIATIIERV